MKRAAAKDAHDRRFKKHFILSIEYRGKADSAYVHCSCGCVECVAVWYTDPLDSSTPWTDFHGAPILLGRVVSAVASFLNAIHPTSQQFPGLPTKENLATVNEYKGLLKNCQNMFEKTMKELKRVKELKS